MTSLKKRYKIENLFATLKQFKKIQLRYETKIKSFMAFLKIAILFIGYRVLLKES